MNTSPNEKEIRKIVEKLLLHTFLEEIRKNEDIQKLLAYNNSAEVQKIFLDFANEFKNDIDEYLRLSNAEYIDDLQEIKGEKI